jgi:hypothetical protein
MHLGPQITRDPIWCLSDAELGPRAQGGSYRELDRAYLVHTDNHVKSFLFSDTWKAQMFVP